MSRQWRKEGHEWGGQRESWWKKNMIDAVEWSGEIQLYLIKWFCMCYHLSHGLRSARIYRISTHTNILDPFCTLFESGKKYVLCRQCWNICRFLLCSCVYNLKAIECANHTIERILYVCVYKTHTHIRTTPIQSRHCLWRNRLYLPLIRIVRLGIRTFS